jgi:hypothetical protein
MLGAHKKSPSWQRWALRTEQTAVCLIQYLGIEHRAIDIQWVVHVFDDHQ